MAAPKGNQYAKGNPNSGRPPKYDLEKEAAELLEFSKRDSCIKLEDFTYNKDYCASDLCDFARKSEVFSSALKKAKERIGSRREDFANIDKLNYGIWNRSARLYSTLLRDDEEDVKDLDLERKIKLAEYQAKVASEQNRALTMPPREEVLLLEDEIIKLKSKLRQIENAS